MSPKKRQLVDIDPDVLERASELGIKVSPTLRFLLSWYLNEGLHNPKMPIFLPKPSRETRHYYEKLKEDYPERRESACEERVVKQKTFIEQVEDAVKYCEITRETVAFFGYITAEMTDAVYRRLIDNGVVTSKNGVSSAMEEIFNT